LKGDERQQIAVFSWWEKLKILWLDKNRGPIDSVKRAPWRLLRLSVPPGIAKGTAGGETLMLHRRNLASTVW